MRPQGFSSQFEGSNRLLSADCGKIFEEFVETLAGFEVVDETLDRHPGACKHRSTTKDFGIDLNDGRWIGHGSHLSRHSSAGWPFLDRCG